MFILSVLKLLIKEIDNQLLKLTVCMWYFKHRSLAHRISTGAERSLSKLQFSRSLNLERGKGAGGAAGRQH